MAKDDMFKIIYCILKELYECMKQGVNVNKEDISYERFGIPYSYWLDIIIQMQEKGFDLYTSLPLLSVYLGHKHITETEYYLRMVEEHFGGILDRAASHAPDIFPQCGEEDTE